MPSATGWQIAAAVGAVYADFHILRGGRRRQAGLQRQHGRIRQSRGRTLIRQLFGTPRLPSDADGQRSGQYRDHRQRDENIGEHEAMLLLAVSHQSQSLHFEALPDRWPMSVLMGMSMLSTTNVTMTAKKKTVSGMTAPRSNSRVRLKRES